MTIQLDVVTVESVVFSGDVDIVIVPGQEGEMGILPHHADLMTTLMPGELVARQNGDEFCLAISGGFMEVRPDRVIILADSAERAEEIDLARAEEAKKRAQEKLAHSTSKSEAALAEAALRRAISRIQVAGHRKQRRRN